MTQKVLQWLPQLPPLYNPLFQPIIERSLQKVQQYNQITNDAVAESNRKNIERTTNAPLVDIQSQIGLEKPPGIDISV